MKKEPQEPAPAEEKKQKTSAKGEASEPTLLRWQVVKVPEAGYLKIGRVNAFPTAEVNLPEDKAEAVNQQLPGALVLLGV